MSINLSDKTLDALAQVISGGAAGAIETVGLYKRGWELKAWFKRFGVDYEEGSRVASTREALKEKGFRRIDKRIAKLAIHSASALSLFLIETWQVRFPDRKLPLAEE